MLIIFTLFVVQYCISFVSAQSGGTSSPLDGLPPCALTCLLTTRSQCQVLDFDCSCKDADFQANAEKCVLQSCTIREGLTTKNITSSLCHEPVRDATKELKALIIALVVPTQISVISRVIGKLAGLGRGFGSDDFCIVVATYLGLGTAMMIYTGAMPNGLGKDVWTLSFPKIQEFARFFYFIEIFYFLSLTFVKLSFLFFYQRIFPGRNVGIVISATIVFNCLFGAGFCLAGVFACQPISYSWKHWDGPKPDGKCLNNNALVWANGGISVAVDFWMLAIPLSQVIYLQTTLKRKIALASMFMVGTVVTVVSIVRLHSLIDFAKSTNPTWAQADATLWSTIEVNVGILCACMPMYRIFLIRIFPKHFGSTGNSPESSYNERARIHLEEQRRAPDSSGERKNKARKDWMYQGMSEISHVETQRDDQIELDTPAEWPGA